MKHTHKAKTNIPTMICQFGLELYIQSLTKAVSFPCWSSIPPIFSYCIAYSRIGVLLLYTPVLVGEFNIN